MTLIAGQPVVAAEPPSELETPKAPNPDVSYLVVELLGRAKFIGFPAVCPGSSPDEDQSEVICIAELYEAPARVIRNLGGAKTEWRLNIRFTAHSAHALWKKGRRFLLGVLPFEDKGRTGHFAWSWDWENENNEFCEGLENLTKFDKPFRDFYSEGRTFVARENDPNWSEGYQVVCVKGPGLRRK